MLAFRRRIRSGVAWTALRYHKRPTVPATALDMSCGLGVAALTIIFARADLVHVRSCVPGAMVLPWILAARVPLLFDARGLWADEKIRSGAWQEGSRVYRTAKSVERRLFRHADATVVLTHAMRDYIRQEYPHRGEARKPIVVIPTCTDLGRFSLDARPDPDVVRELRDARVLVHAGSLGSVYLARETAAFYLAWRRVAGPSRLLLVSREEPTAIRDELRRAGVAHELVHRVASPEQVPSLLRCGHASVGLVATHFASRGSAPTRLGEALGCGLPTAMTSVGDVARVLDGSPAGVVVDDLSAPGLEQSARRLAEISRQPGVSAAARALAERWFDLRRGVEAYDRVYRAMPRRHSTVWSAADTGWP